MASYLPVFASAKLITELIRILANTSTSQSFFCSKALRSKCFKVSLLVNSSICVLYFRVTLPRL